MFADPGYLGDPRLPLDTSLEIRASWARIMHEAAGYNPGQRETIKARLRKAAHEHGITLESYLSRSQTRRIFAQENLPEPVFEVTLDATPLANALQEASDAIANLQQAVEGHTGCMVALYPRSSVAGRIAVDGGEPPAELHVTLAYLGEASGLDLERLKAVVAGVAEGAVPLTGEISGIGVFTANPEAAVTYASVDVPALAGFRQRLFDALVDASFPVATSHGYTPHMTLAYNDLRGLEVPNLPLEFDQVWIVAAGVRFSFDLRGDEQPYEENIGPAEPANEQPAGYVKETEEIHKRKKAEGSKPHDFQPAKWTHPNGHPRCALCCNEEPMGGHCPGGETDDLQHEAVKESLKPLPPEPAAPAAKKPAKKPAKKQTARLLESVTELLADDNTAGQELLAGEVSLTRAFVTEVAGKTILTAPVETLKAEHFGKNPHYLWMEGAFVGAEEPNRNGALWSTADLEFGEFTVKNGPLNWLHEARHVIGSIVDGRLVTPTDVASEGAAAVPHIRATAAVWKWIFPDEAQVIEFAAEVGKLFYSMECISEEVKCVGDNGCGESFSYQKAMSGRACDHIRDHASIRQLVNPTFLGGAVIVPPVRPGWAHSDVNLLRQAAAFSESAYEQMGRPAHLEAAVLDQIMAEVVAYAQA